MYRFNKYSNQKVILDNIKFDSKKEANRYSELKIFEKAGEISNLQLQKLFLLIDKQKDERAVTYKADFVYYDNKKGRWIAEDVKGYKTKEYIIKRKLFKSIYGKDYDFIEVWCMIGDVQRESIEKVRNMYYTEGKTIKEIAETLHFTQSTVQEYINV